MSESFKRTGAFCTEDQADSIRHAASMPMIRVGGNWPDSPQDVTHRCALQNGLPEITGTYGVDLRNREFILFSGAK